MGGTKHFLKNVSANKPDIHNIVILKYPKRKYLRPIFETFTHSFRWLGESKFFFLLNILWYFKERLKKQKKNIHTDAHEIFALKHEIRVSAFFFFNSALPLHPKRKKKIYIYIEELQMSKIYFLEIFLKINFQIGRDHACTWFYIHIYLNEKSSYS